MKSIELTYNQYNLNFATTMANAASSADGSNYSVEGRKKERNWVTVNSVGVFKKRKGKDSRERVKGWWNRNTTPFTKWVGGSRSKVHFFRSFFSSFFPLHSESANNLTLQPTSPFPSSSHLVSPICYRDRCDTTRRGGVEWKGKVREEDGKN